MDNDRGIQPTQETGSFSDSLKNAAHAAACTAVESALSVARYAVYTAKATRELAQFVVNTFSARGEKINGEKYGDKTDSWRWIERTLCVAHNSNVAKQRRLGRHEANLRAYEYVNGLGACALSFSYIIKK